MDREGQTWNAIRQPWQVFEGSPQSSVVLHVPHGATAIPADVRSQLLLDDRELALELGAMTDSFTGAIARHAAEAAQIRPWVFANGLSRLVIDPERFTDGTEEMEAVGMGAVYTGTSDGRQLRQVDADTRTDLIKRYFDPYAEALQLLVSERLRTCGRVTIIDIHSYATRVLPYELHKSDRRPPFCIGTDDFHTPHWLRDSAFAAMSDVGACIENEPFSGTYVPLAYYGREAAVRSLMIEIRRDQYMDEHDLMQDSGRVALIGRGLATIVDTVGAV